MTIGLIIPTLYGGGAERVVVNLANYFSSKDKVYIVSEFEGGDYSNLISDSVNRYSTGGKTISRIKQFIDEVKPDLVMSTLPSANAKTYLALKQAKHRPVFVLREARILNRGLLQFRNIKDMIAHLIDIQAYKYCDYVIANSPDTKESIIKRMHILPDKITVIGNPVLDNATIESNRQDTCSLQCEKYILSVGRFVRDKRFDILINAFNLIKDRVDVNLYIYGHGPLEKELQSLIDSLHLPKRVFLKGFVTNIIEKYKDANCFVLSSDFEGFGNVLVEALSCGVPIVSTKCKGGPSYILDNGKYGVLVPQSDSHAMAQAIVDVLESRIVFDKEELISRARDFSVESSSEKYRSFFKSCL